MRRTPLLFALLALAAACGDAPTASLTEPDGLALSLSRHAPGAAERYTMLVVTFAGALGSALAEGAVIGHRMT